MLAVGWHARKGHEAWERDKTVKGTEKNAAAQHRIEELRGELERKQQ